MGHSSSREAALTPEQAELLLDMAEAAIRARLEGRRSADAAVERLPERLRQPSGAFVTLHVDGQLNGCIGNIDSVEPIGVCVPRLATEAAFEDPRLPQLRHRDLPGLHIEISLLSPRTPIPAGTRAELLDQLRPHVDGLSISSGRRRAVFLPAVWQQLPEPNDFLNQLLLKAGLAADVWPAGMHADVFTTSSFGR